MNRPVVFNTQTEQRTVPNNLPQSSVLIQCPASQTGVAWAPSSASSTPGRGEGVGRVGLGTDPLLTTLVLIPYTHNLILQSSHNRVEALLNQQDGRIQIRRECKLIRLLRSIAMAIVVI